MPRKPAQPKELLSEILENYAWALEFWAPIHKEGNQDVKFIAGDPWDPRDIEARETAEQKRPHLVFDEGSQYINQFLGQSMQQQRQVKVEPVDQRIDAETATVMQGRIQHIDYTSRGPTHTMKGLHDCATRGYGWISIRKKYSSETGREQEPCYNPVNNPDSRLMDPNAKESDGSDAEFVFVRDVVKKSYVKKKWKWAKELGLVSQKTITLTEYWKVTKEVVDRTFWLEDQNNPEGIEIKESDLPEGSKVEEDHIVLGQEPTTFTAKILDCREEEKRTVTKYVCQIVDPGTPFSASVDDSPADKVEILEVEEWDGDNIPEIPILGPEYYINESGTVKRVYLSLLRRAREPMQLLNLTRTNEAEMVSMTPKTRFMGYEGQFEGHETEFQQIGVSPIAYLQVKAVIDPTSNTVLPLPEVIRWEPPIQALELLAQSCMNAIRAAIGQLASPELDKTKSGVALQKIQAAGASAVYHMTEAYERSLEQVGRVIGNLIEKTHDTKREVPIRTPDRKSRIVTMNAPYDDEHGKRVHYPIVPGAAAYTITTGPSYQSQYEQASDFVDKLVTGMPMLLLDGTGHTMFGDLFVALKNLGPIGDMIVERFKKILKPGLEDTPMDVPPQVQQELQKGQQIIDALTGKVKELQGVLESKMLEIQSDERRAEMESKTKIAIAEINASVKENIAELEHTMASIAQRMNQQFEQMMAQLPPPGPAQVAPSAPEAGVVPAAGSVAGQPASPSGATELMPASGQEPTHVFNPETEELEPVGAPQ